jgi:hypothetical protein
MNYQNIYNQIINRAKNRTLNEYKESHHVIPKCLGGSNEKENLVDLTAREHFLCHKLLVEIYPNNEKLLWALWLMAIGKQRRNKTEPYNVSSRAYERIKLLFIEKSKQKTVTEEHKQKIAEKNGYKVYQFDFDGNFIKEWNTCQEAERFYNLKGGDNISATCRGGQKSAYGYLWSYKNEKPIVKYTSKKRRNAHRNQRN